MPEKSRLRCVDFCLLAAFAGLALGGSVGAGWPGPALATELKLDGTRPLTDPLVCLARTIYFEAGGQSEQEKAAVAHVVLNRARSSAYPDDVCAVIREGGETAPCQFSWWCDGRSDVAVDKDEYDRVVAVARGVMSGRIKDPTDGANMYHNTDVAPDWTREAERRGQIGDQIFYFLKDR
jgi:spore germination cell wall hydrolase CwlJ-like protein